MDIVHKLCFGSVMASLTSIVPEIAPLLDMTPVALYERQRALVRLGLLPKPQGRGRGSGAEATPQNVALLVISALITESLSNMDERVAKLAEARFDGSLQKKKTGCYLTGKWRFKNALAAILADVKLAKRVARLYVDRRNAMAHIHSEGTRRRVSTFGRELSDALVHVHVSVWVPGNTLHAIARVLQSHDWQLESDEEDAPK